MVVRNELRDVCRASVMEGFEDSDFIIESFVGVGSAKLFVDVSEEIDADVRANAIFKILHRKL